MTQALIVVDIQNDFVDGTLAVTSGQASIESVIEGVNQLMTEVPLVVATLDWHPANHSSFIKNNPKGIWPVHCVQNSRGAELHGEIDDPLIDKIIVKGTNPEADSYSGFFDDNGGDTGMNAYLKSQGVTEVVVVGLALDYCVKATALDAVKCGYKTTVIEKLTKAVNINPNDGAKAVAELQAAGVVVK